MTLQYVDIKQTATIGDKVYETALANIQSTHLGFDPDHNSFSFSLHFLFDGYGQSTGYRNFNPSKPESYEMIERIITVVSGDYSSWEGLKGKDVWILKDPVTDMIVGLVNRNLHSVFVMFND